MGSRKAPPPPFLPLEGGERGSAAGALASGAVRDSAASSLTGGGIAVSSLSQESFVIADPVPVASSCSPAHVHRSQSKGKGDSTGDCPCSRSYRLFPPRGQDSREEHHSACSRS